MFVGGLPSGVDAAIRLVGTSGVHDLVDSGSVELDPGSYAAEDPDTDGASPAGSVTNADDAIGVAWHDGRLYAMNGNPQVVLPFDAPEDIVGTTPRDPSAVFTVGQPCTADIAKDAAGRYWIASSGEVAGRYPDLATVGDGSVLSADVTVTHGELPGGGGIAFRMTSLE